MPQILNPETAFTGDQRAELLAECFPAMLRREQVLGLMDSADASTRDALRPELDRLNAQIRQHWEDYQQHLPIMALSRCPFTQQLWSHSFDYLGIEGLWWNCYKPVRRLDEPQGGGFYAFRGAVAPPPAAPASAAPANTPAPMPAIPFLVEPGSDVPCVIDRLMQMPSITAVISHVRVGMLDAYPIVYFTQSPLPDDQRTNDWGTDSFAYRGDQGYYEEGRYFDAEDEFLYNLEPWIDQRRVWWIEPGDESLTLQQGVAGCPYMKMPGKQAVWRTKMGRLWWGPVGKT